MADRWTGVFGPVTLWAGICVITEFQNAIGWSALSGAIALGIWWRTNRLTFLLCFLLGIAIMGWRVVQVPDIAAQLSGHTFLVRLLEDPKLQASQYQSVGFEKSERALADVLKVDGVDAHFTVLLTTPNGKWEISDELRCNGKLQSAIGLHKYQAFLNCERAKLAKSASRLQKFALAVRHGLQEVSQPLKPEAGADLLPGLVLGDTSQVSALDTSLMQSAGLGHLTAVSGANVAIVLGAVSVGLAWLRLSVRSRLIVQVLVLFVFVVVVRPSPSVVRAAAMALLGLWTVWTGNRRHSLSILVVASFALLVIDPWLATSWGFALSVAATLGLIGLAPLIAGDSAPKWRQAVATAIAAGVSTLPVLLLMGRPPSFASIPANVIAEILVAPATIFGVIAAVLGWLAAWLAPLNLVAALFAQVGVWCASAILQVAAAAVHSWWNVSLWTWWSVGVLAAGAISFSFFRQLWWSLALIAMLVPLAALPLPLISNWPAAGWLLISCDVGQGDATLVNLGDGVVVGIDAGPDPVLYRKCLELAGATEIRAQFFSHMHADHVAGILGINDLLPIASVFLPCTRAPAAGSNFVEAALPRTSIREMAEGAVYRFREVAISVLRCPIIQVSDAVGSEVNNTTAVLAIETSGRNFLLTGDIETDAQIEIMQHFQSSRFDVVKIPHHGSSSQASEFAGWTGAGFAWVSVAAQNVYGHPAAATLDNYRAAGITVLSTAECGSVAWTDSEVQTQSGC